ncbi:unnamed protein product, partial [Phaeothamnion confervicola]
ATKGTVQNVHGRKRCRFKANALQREEGLRCARVPQGGPVLFSLRFSFYSALKVIEGINEPPCIFPYAACTCCTLSHQNETDRDLSFQLLIPSKPFPVLPAGPLCLLSWWHVCNDRAVR